MSKGGVLDRRMLLTGLTALAGCDKIGLSQAQAEAAPPSVPPPSLKTLAPFRIGTCVQAGQIADPVWAALAAQNCNQLTPEWEMKMEYVVGEDGAFRFDRSDAISDFARHNGMRLYGTALVWYAEKPNWFQKLPPDRAGFAKAYDGYIQTLVQRYRGAVGWDVVNEAVAEDGEGWRQSLWSERLGDFDHMVRAFHVAKAADPDAVLFLNDYNLEYLPKKLDTFQKLLDRLLSAGAPVSGIGAQTHVNADLEPGLFPKTLETLAKFGLPIHVSELDVSMVRAEKKFPSPAAKQSAQSAVFTEVAHAYSSLPDHQKFALTLWGLRDSDSWLQKENATDTPCIFDTEGQANPAASALAKGLGWKG